ncbi:TPA: hypothetical protein KSG52_004181 [Clostridioides difficile]|uniref:hypothetical protein n=1 Tax=Clostridioides difficile TaxID=1496 RepID=UPI001034B93B|nr:hypothetical protein [Clostridioides difficile]MBH7395276.1 hypothetical protein [Clostridioides difficile]MBH7646905.1 hypothetical protein [Clostridioides difficile]MCO8945850.1 hypothetical protein [Clostridioides difficile]HBF9129320.1 hypothetical protein [Clostridioides difficile]HBH3024756.1 hypothetical protein [Clostridioides difficile]
MQNECTALFIRELTDKLFSLAVFSSNSFRTLGILRVERTVSSLLYETDLSSLTFEFLIMSLIAYRISEDLRIPVWQEIFSKFSFNGVYILTVIVVILTPP